MGVKVGGRGEAVLTPPLPGIRGVWVGMGMEEKEVEGMGEREGMAGVRVA